MRNKRLCTCHSWGEEVFFCVERLSNGLKILELAKVTRYAATQRYQTQSCSDIDFTLLLFFSPKQQDAAGTKVEIYILCFV